MPAGMPRLNQVHEDREAMTSEDVVGVSTDSILDVMEVQQLSTDESTSTSSTSSSVLPNGVGLNEPAGVNALKFLERAAATAFEEVNSEKPLVAIPTADLISHTSFKAGSKFVIRIVPKADGSSKNKRSQDQAKVDKGLYFDRASLQGTSEVSEERYQIFEGFDAETVFLFGERPKIWNFQLIVVNAARPNPPLALQQPGNEQALEAFMRRWNMDFCDELIRRYERYYRGTRAAELRATVYMSYEDVLIEATLLSLVAARINMSTAVSVSLTFIVHQRSFLGSDLSFGSDATLAELLDTEEQDRLVTERIKPSSIVPAKRTADQLIADYAANQAATQASQAKATAVALEQNLTASLASINAELAAAQAVAVQALAAQAAAETDPVRRAQLMGELAAARADLDAATALAQEFAAAADVREAELAEAARANEAALEAQRTQEAALRSNPSGNLVNNSGSFVYFVDVVGADASGALVRETYRAPDEETANSIAAGADPESVGAVLEDAAPETFGGSRRTVRVEIGFGSTT